MAGLADFRAQHPEYNDMSDTDLSNALYTKFYSDIPRDQFDAKMGASKPLTDQLNDPLHPVLPAQTAGAAPPQQPESKLAEFGAGISRPIANVDRAVAALADKVGIDTGGDKRYANYKKNIAADRQSGKIAPHSWAELAGNVVGTAPVLATGMNPFMAGALSGALTTDRDTVGGAVADTATGGVFGKAGEVGTRALGAVVAPRVSGAVNYLLSKGVKLTPGQIVGGTLHRIEDAATSNMLPFVSDAQTRSLHSFNKALVNEALTPLGVQLGDKVPAGHASIAAAQDAMDQSYRAVVPHLALTSDPTLQTNVASLKSLVANMPGDYPKMFNTLLDNEVTSKFGQSGKISGDTYKEIEETLTKEAKDFGGKNASGPQDRRYSDAVRQLQQELRDAAQRQNPNYADQLGKINQGYALLTRVEKAAANTKDGVVTPSQYRNAVVQSDNSVRRRVSAAGGALGQDMATAGETVLPRTVPESGTVPRGIVNGLTAAALFGGGHALSVNPLGLGAIAAALLPYTERGGAVASKLLTARPAAAMAARRALQASAPAVANTTATRGVVTRDQNLNGDQ